MKNDIETNFICLITLPLASYGIVSYIYSVSSEKNTCEVQYTQT